MITNLYMFYDRVAGFYSKPFNCINDATAVRTFRSYLNSLDEVVRQDMELYKLGSVDEVSGILSALDKPEFIFRGVE